MQDPIRVLALRDGRFSPEAFRFLFEALDTAVRGAGKDKAEGAARHVSGQEVLVGMQQYGLEVFGPLAAHVWRSWGVYRAIDWGHIVFLLVDAGLLNRQESDRLEDFDVEMDFDEVFTRGYRPPIEPEGAAPGGDAN